MIEVSCRAMVLEHDVDSASHWESGQVGSGIEGQSESGCTKVACGRQLSSGNVQ